MNKFRQFAFDLLTNRLGIFLATVNLCFFVSRDFNTWNLKLNFFEKIMLAQNFPAIVLARVLYEILYAVSPKIMALLNVSALGAGVLIVVAFQWLFVAWLAKITARTLRKNFLNQG